MQARPMQLQVTRATRTQLTAPPWQQHHWVSVLMTCCSCRQVRNNTPGSGCGLQQALPWGIMGLKSSSRRATLQHASDPSRARADCLWACCKHTMRHKHAVLMDSKWLAACCCTLCEPAHTCTKTYPCLKQRAHSHSNHNRQYTIQCEKMPAPGAG